MKELLGKGRNICVGDQINIPAEVIALVNDGFDAFAVIKAGQEYVEYAMMDADVLMSIKYGGAEMKGVATDEYC